MIFGNGPTPLLLLVIHFFCIISYRKPQYLQISVEGRIVFHGHGSRSYIRVITKGFTGL